MFDEIYQSMSRNRLRIALTGFSIAWGIFMLIVLLGSGNGLMNGSMENFGNQAQNRVQLWPGWTSNVYRGLPKGRDIKFDWTDIEYLRQTFPHEIADIQPTIETSARVSYGREYSSGTLSGVFPDFWKTEDFLLSYGRSINEVDIRDKRKVCVLHDKTIERLFGDTACHVGQWVNMYDIPFLIIGQYHTKREARRDGDMYAPLSTVGTIYKPDGHYSQFTLRVENLETAEANEEFNKALKAAMGRKNEFDADDSSAMWIWNSYEDYLQTMKIFNGLRLFIWIIGLATLIAGVTGISNIMLITVKERTHEFGIRKAIGARPREIIALVLLESVAITLVFGYLGMLVGIGLTQMIDWVLSNSPSDGFTIFKHPTVDLGIILMATTVMVIAGVIAGYMPAKRAVSIKPVEALSEK